MVVWGFLGLPLPRRPGVVVSGVAAESAAAEEVAPLVSGGEVEGLRPRFLFLSTIVENF